MIAYPASEAKQNFASMLDALAGAHGPTEALLEQLLANDD